MGAKPRISEEQLAKWRQTGIRLDSNGRFWHEGQEITHKRLRLALLRWLDKLPTGQTILRLDEKRYAFIDVDDCDLLVCSVSWQGDDLFGRLNDETTERIFLQSLSTGPQGAIYCHVRQQKLVARFSTKAQQLLSPRIEERKGRAAIFAGGHWHEIKPWKKVG